jgi:hypothetical protein
LRRFALNLKKVQKRCKASLLNFLLGFTHLQIRDYDFDEKLCALRIAATRNA